MPTQFVREFNQTAKRRGHTHSHSHSHSLSPFPPVTWKNDFLYSPAVNWLHQPLPLCARAFETEVAPAAPSKTSTLGHGNLTFRPPKT